MRWLLPKEDRACGSMIDGSKAARYDSANLRRLPALGHTFSTTFHLSLVSTRSLWQQAREEDLEYHIRPC